MYFGTDPEYLIVNRLGRPVPAHKAGFGDKNNKKVLYQNTWDTGPDAWESRAFRDGYMVEVNVKPDTCRQTTTHRMKRAIAALQKMVEPKYRIIAAPAVKINLKADMKDAPDDVLQFGCEPSYDAYTGDTKVPPIDAITHPFRYAGGHLHFGHSGNAKYDWMRAKKNHPGFVKLMDLYVGLPLTYLFDDKRTFWRRRFYGQAGEYRSQQYGKGVTQIGVEYRTPGPEVWNEPWVASFAMGTGRYIGQNYQVLTAKWDKGIEGDLVGAINTGTDVEKLVKRLQLPFHEYPATWLKLKKFAPKVLKLGKSPDQQITAGLMGWMDGHRLEISDNEARGGDY